MENHQTALFARGEDALRSAGDNSPVEWNGLPRHATREKAPTLTLSFESEEERDALVAQLGLDVERKTRKVQTTWWPPRERGNVLRLDL